jgi:hypothetical protein
MLQFMITDISGILNITLNPHVRRLVELLSLKGYSVNPHPANPRWLNVYCPIKGRNIIKEIKTHSEMDHFNYAIFMELDGFLPYTWN